MNGVVQMPSTPSDADLPRFAPFQDGIRHVRFLGHLAASIEAKTYFEIGTSRGNSLAEITCTAVCIDPSFRIERDVVGKKPALMAFQTTSDDFFSRWNLRNLFPAPGDLDLAFLDGMHHFECLLRDFINTERVCSPRSTVVLHDCLPLHPNAARRRDRRQRPNAETARPVAIEKSGWTGDVWKVLRILQKHRPDLRIVVFDCPPSGLVVIRGCNANDRTLSIEYDALVADWLYAEDQPGWFDALHDSVQLLRSRDYLDRARLKAELGIV
jgi:hypothetical protein